MNRRTILTTIAVIVLIGLAATGAYALYGNRDQEKEVIDTTHDSSLDSRPDNATFSGKTGRNIILSKFSAKFALPERIDVTDVRILYKTTDKYETAVVASNTLPSKLRKDQCGGGTLEMGGFAEITRYKTPEGAQDLQKVGDYYYYVSKGPAAKNCYDDASFAKYYGDDVVPAIKATLKTQ